MSSDTPAARLEALGPAIEEIDGANPSSEQQQAQQAEQAQVSAAEQGAREWGMLMFTIGGFACMLAPELRQVYTEERCVSWGASANAVAEKYGWNSPGVMPEIALAASTIGFVLPTYIVIRQKVEQSKEGGPAGMLGKVVLWWRARRAGKAAGAAMAQAAARQGQAKGGANGGNE